MNKLTIYTGDLTNFKSFITKQLKGLDYYFVKPKITELTFPNHKNKKQTVKVNYLDLLELIKNKNKEIFILDQLEKDLSIEKLYSTLYHLIELIYQKDIKVIISTYSPYLINYLTLSIKANQIVTKEPSKALSLTVLEIKNDIPLAFKLSSVDVDFYEFKEESPRLLEKYDGLITDDNYLNNLLAKSNEIFSDLLDLEDK